MGGGPGAMGGGGAAAGATALGGGPPGSMQAVVAALQALIPQLTALIQQLGGAAPSAGAHTGHVQGVQGGPAMEGQFVKPLDGPVAAGGSEDGQFEQRVLELINDYRTKRGLAPVTYNPTLDVAAEKHAAHMSAVGRMAHDGIGDGDSGGRIRAEGFRNAWGENVATGQTSPEQVVAEWIASPEHLRNIVDPNFTQMGVGYVTAADGRSYWAQNFGA